MGRKIFDLVLAVGAALGMTGCLGDANTSSSTDPVTYTVSSDAYVLNSGNLYSGINGSLTAYDLDSWEVTDSAYYKQNRQTDHPTLGMTPNEAAIYGTKMYIAVTGENSVFVVDKNTLKLVKVISTTDVFGTDKGKQPRRLVGGFGKVYVTTYDGYVSAIDTVNYSLTSQFQVGSYPEDLELSSSGLMYVANSDYGYGKKASITKIDVNSNTVSTTITKNVVNPQQIEFCNNCIFVTDWSSYNDDYSVRDSCDSVGVVCDDSELVHLHKATMMAALDNQDAGITRLYLVYAPYGQTPEYTVYTPYGSDYPKLGELSTFITGGPKYPAAIACDANTGYVYIAAYNENASGTGADYSAPGYVNVYTYKGASVKTGLLTGVGPVQIVTNQNTYTY